MMKPRGRRSVNGIAAFQWIEILRSLHTSGIYTSVGGGDAAKAKVGKAMGQWGGAER